MFTIVCKTNKVRMILYLIFPIGPVTEKRTLSLDHRLTRACCLRDNSQVNVDLFPLWMSIISSLHDDSHGQGYQLNPSRPHCSPSVTSCDLSHTFSPFLYVSLLSVQFRHPTPRLRCGECMSCQRTALDKSLWLWWYDGIFLEFQYKETGFFKNIFLAHIGKYGHHVTMNAI